MPFFTRSSRAPQGNERIIDELKRIYQPNPKVETADKQGETFFYKKVYPALKRAAKSGMCSHREDIRTGDEIKLGGIIKAATAEGIDVRKINYDGGGGHSCALVFSGWKKVEALPF